MQKSIIFHINGSQQCYLMTNVQVALSFGHSRIYLIWHVKNQDLLVA